MAYQGTNYGAELLCTCCHQCNNNPCDGAAAGGFCDGMCDCDEEDELLSLTED